MSQNNNLLSAKPPYSAAHASKAVALFLIKLYQSMVSPLTGGKAVCRFIPTCSEYTRQAVQKYGPSKGIGLGIRRLSRCRPGGGFGYDPVP